MMRNRTNAVIGVAGLLALGTLGTLVSVGQAAAILTLDLRVHGTGGKTATIANIGDTVQLDLYAVLQNNDNNHANDGILKFQGGFYSTESAAPAGLYGNLAAATPSASLSASLFSGGTPTNKDANLDLELAGTDPNNANSGWVVMNSSATPSYTFGTGTGSGATEFLLVSTVWTATSDSGTTSLSFALRPATSGTAAAKTVAAFQADGTIIGNALYDNANIAYGAPVVIAVPEPAAIGLLALGALPLLARRRRMPASA